MKITSKITKRDLLEIEKISGQRFGNESWTEAQFESSYSLDSSIFLVAFEKEKLVSFLIGQDTVDSINILLLATEKEFEKKGFAGALVKELAEKFKGKKLWLEVKESNSCAIKFYQKNGFKPVYTRKKYYKDGENAIILEREN